MTTIAATDRIAERISASHRLSPSRYALAFAAGMTAAVIVLWLRLSGRSNFADFDQVWIPARALLRGDSPFLALRFTTWGDMIYPMPAVIAALPFAILPSLVAHAVFVGLGIGLAAYALGGKGEGVAIALLSYPTLDAIQLGQWSPLIVAAGLLPGLAWLAAVKPTTAGAVVLTARRIDRIGVVVSLGLMVASFLVAPDWVSQWLTVIRRAHGNYKPLVFHPWGWLLLLAALRWRRTDAQILFALAIIPQTLAPYEALALTLALETRREAMVYSALSLLMVPLLTSIDRAGSFGAMIDHNAQALLWCLYVPVTLMVLRRPNVTPA